jgi:hypothetical protein
MKISKGSVTGSRAVEPQESVTFDGDAGSTRKGENEGETTMPGGFTC